MEIVKQTKDNILKIYEDGTITIKDEIVYPNLIVGIDYIEYNNSFNTKYWNGYSNTLYNKYCPFNCGLDIGSLLCIGHLTKDYYEYFFDDWFIKRFFFHLIYSMNNISNGYWHSLTKETVKKRIKSEYYLKYLFLIMFFSCWIKYKKNFKSLVFNNKYFKTFYKIITIINSDVVDEIHILGNNITEWNTRIKRLIDALYIDWYNFRVIFGEAFL